ncbi:hypothetical protein [Caballeronia sp. dw_19]|uniref:hypothetical protein n=1 Tax=Caballeronia sp. dw_19 TaxID=2719791 RepID=UPI001BD25769|nr:hypothetical protein [Caballeronia sp. dw_19]
MLVNKPATILIASTLLSFLSYVQINLQQAIALATVTGHPNSEQAGLSLALSLCVVIISVILSIISVQAMRHSLSGVGLVRSLGLFDEGFFGYMGLCFSIALVVVVFLVGVVPTAVIGWGVIQVKLGYGAHILLFASVFGIVAISAVIFVGVRLTLLFYNVAVGRGLPWRAAWRDTRGHVWSIGGARFITCLPILAIAVGGYFAGHNAIVHPSSAMQRSFWAVFRAISAIVAASVSASSSAWQYRRYADHILRSIRR